MGIKKTIIGHACIVGDGAHASINRVEFGIPYLTSKNFNKDGIYLQQVDYISEQDYQKHFREESKALTKPSEGDLIFSIIGSIGGAYLYNRNDRFGLSSSVAIIRPNKTEIHPLFLLYYLKSPYLQKWIEAIKSGSAQGFLSLEMIKNLPLLLPPLATQQKIASILSAYDELIENNKQRIKLLESMAEEIYKEWFVRLRFPNYENTTFIDGLPIGWEETKLENQIKIFRGKSYTSEELRESDGLPMLNLKNINRGGGFRRDGLKYFEGKFTENNLAFAGDIILAVTDMTQNRELVGRVARVPQMNISQFVFSMDLIKITPIFFPKNFVYSFFRFSGIGLKLAEFANGANVLHLTPNLINYEKAKFPTLELAIKFDEIITPIFDEIDILENKNQLLQQTRDLLLPRLISGKLRVEEKLYKIEQPEMNVSMAAELAGDYEAK
jgi:type I restriction enzyme S subunit